MTKPVLQVIIGSTRPGRAGAPIATWFYDLAVADGRFDVELVDLAEVNLPIFNEPNHPIQGKYEFDHTKRWSATVSRGDAFVFVVPEYNHSFNAATKNALDYLHNEWRYKPVGIVSYGGAVMGTRSAQHLKPVFTALKLVHAGDVSIPLVTVPVVDGVFTGNDAVTKSAQNLLNELDFITPGLMQLRAGR